MDSSVFKSDPLVNVGVSDKGDHYHPLPKRCDFSQFSKSIDNTSGVFNKYKILSYLFLHFFYVINQTKLDS